MNLSSGVITTVAGTGTYGTHTSGIQAKAANLADPAGLAFDSSGNLYIAERENEVVSKVDLSTGVITIVAGTMGQTGFSGDNGAATSAKLTSPSGIAISGTSLFIADRDNARVRQVNLSTGTITTVAGNGTFSFAGNGGTGSAAELDYPRAVAVDSAGNLYIADTYNFEIREVDLTPAVVPVSISKAPLSITANSAMRLQGVANPTFTVAYSGFVNGDGPSSLNPAPAATTSATTSSTAGSYAITVGGAGSSNYAITYAPGTLTVNAVVTPPAPGKKVLGNVPTGKGKKTTQGITLNLSSMVNASAAASLGNYSLTTVPKGKKGKATKLPIKSVMFNAATGSLILIPKKKITQNVVLHIAGQAGGTITIEITKSGQVIG